MSSITIEETIAKLIIDVKLNTVDDLFKQLDSKIEIDEDLKAMFNEFKLNITKEGDHVVKKKAIKKKGKKNGKGKGDDGSATESVSEDKKKRKPTMFNFYVKKRTPDVGFSVASKAWKTDDHAIFIKNKVKQLRKEDEDATDQEIFDRAWDLYVPQEIQVPQDEDEDEDDNDDGDNDGSDDEDA